MKMKHSCDTNPMVRIPRIIQALNGKAIQYRIIEARSEEADSIAEWLEKGFPLTGSQINWQKVPYHIGLDWTNEAELETLFPLLIKDLALTARVVITWSDALRPSIEMQLGDVKAVQSEVLGGGFDTWILCRDEKWCIEIHHEGTLCRGRSQA